MYKKTVINLNDIEINEITDIHYNYKNINFLFKNKKSKNLIISFHGAINPDTPLPVFRLYDYECKNSDILSISDKILEDNNDKQLLLSWYLSDDTNNYDNIYQNIINYFIQNNNYENTIFIGSSGGAYPALKYASFFNKDCIIYAGQIYLDKYNYFNHFINKTKLNLGNINMEDYIKRNGPPNRIILYQNILDTHHYLCHAKKFVEFMNINYCNIIEVSYFEHSDEDHLKKLEGKKGYFDGWKYHGGKFNLPVGINLKKILYDKYNIIVD
jgi:hypothetical protein